MTLQEKRLNKEDLGNWKNENTQINAMIPGIHNNAAGVHLKRTRQRDAEQVPGKLKMSMSQPFLTGSSSSGYRNGALSPEVTRDKDKFLNNIISDANIEKHQVKD